MAESVVLLSETEPGRLLPSNEKSGGSLLQTGHGADVGLSVGGSVIGGTQ